MHPCIALISPQNISRGSDRGGGSDEKLKPERSEMRETRVNNLFCSSKPTAVLIAPDNDTVTLLIERIKRTKTGRNHKIIRMVASKKCNKMAVLFTSFPLVVC